MTTLSLKGVVDADVAALFLEELAGLSSSDAPVTIDMREAELEDATLIGALEIDGGSVCRVAGSGATACGVAGANGCGGLASGRVASRSVGGPPGCGVSPYRCGSIGSLVDISTSI